MPSLVCERGQEKGFSFSIVPGAPIVVGRDPANEVIISDPASSRRHFQIRHVDGVWLISDLGSRNHTYLNEEQLTREVNLAYGDRVQVGETVFSFLQEEKTSSGRAKGLVGKDIGGYKILERVGRGGMGTVYKSRQISLNRICALKVLSAKYAKDPTFVQQFVAEARAAGQLQHPNVVQVFDVGEAGGLHFFSMEYMDGGAVQDMLAERDGSRLEWTEALPMMKDACQGLVFAEKHGIVHRDIKPDNLMLSGEGRVKIGDLGLAQHGDGDDSGKIFGTPHFIAPEQARGKTTGHTADIYALGATFYRMVAGRTPFSGKSVKEILKRQISEPHVPLTTELVEFPPDLSAIVDRMMEKDPANRFQSASDLLAEIEEFELAHQIELSGLKKVNKPLRIAMGLVLLALLGVVAWLVTRPKDVEFVEVPGENNNPVGVDPDEVDRIRRENEAKQRSLRAEAEFNKLVGTAPFGEPTLDKEDDWRAKADKFEALAEQHAGTPTVGKANGKARDIRDRLDELRNAFDSTMGAARTWWDGKKAAIGGQLDDGSWKDAVEAAKSTLGGEEWKKHSEHLNEDAKTYLDGVLADALKRARKFLDDALAEGARLLGAGRSRDAVLHVEDAQQTLRLHAVADPRFGELAQSAGDWIATQQQSLHESLKRQLDEDRQRYVLRRARAATVRYRRQLECPSVHAAVRRRGRPVRARHDGPAHVALPGPRRSARRAPARRPRRVAGVRHRAGVGQSRRRRREAGRPAAGGRRRQRVADSGRRTRRRGVQGERLDLERPRQADVPLGGDERRTGLRGLPGRSREQGLAAAGRRPLRPFRRARGHRRREGAEDACRRRRRNRPEDGVGRVRRARRVRLAARRGSRGLHRRDGRGAGLARPARLHGLRRGRRRARTGEAHRTGAGGRREGVSRRLGRAVATEADEPEACPPLRLVAGRLFLDVLVVPGASREGCAGLLDGRLRIRVRAPPERGRANRAVADLLAARLGVRRSEIELVAGAASRRKTWALPPLAPETVRNALGLR